MILFISLTIESYNYNNKSLLKTIDYIRNLSKRQRVLQFAECVATCFEIMLHPNGDFVIRAN